MKKILVIGDANHQFILALSNRIKESKGNYQIDIFNTKSNFDPKNSKNYNKVYYSSSKNRFLIKIPYFNTIYSAFRSIRDFNKIKKKYDYIHIHMATQVSYFIRKELKSKAKNIIITVWGSDFYRLNDNSKKKRKSLYKVADTITFTNPDTLNDFSTYYNLKKKNYRVIRFGLEPLELLKSFSIDKSISRKELNLKNDRIIVTIGYNAAPQQQHVEILESISKSVNFEIIRNECFFVLPLTYAKRPGYDDYKRKVEKILIDNGFLYKIYDSYLTDLEISHLRNASDIMIQMQITDQFSGSMQEYMFCDNLVITGDWLPYKVFDDKKIYFKRISEVCEVDIELFSLINNFKTEKLNVKNNKNKIYELSSWENNILNWLSLYV